MRAFVLSAVLLACACSSKGATPGSAAGSGAGSAAGSGGAGEACGATTCTPPAVCMTVSGMQPDSARQECWIPCDAKGGCPTGYSCAMIHDGPGQVCVEPNPGPPAPVKDTDA